MESVETALNQKRRKAYSFIMDLFGKVSWAHKDFTKETTVAEALKIDVTELISLKNGETDPSGTLVNNLHEFFYGAPKLIAEIDEYLITPFLVK